MERADGILRRIADEHDVRFDSIEQVQDGSCVMSKRKSKRVECFELARQQRASGQQNIGYTSRPFISCGLPVRRCKDARFTRRNGQFKLEITGSQEFGLPFGQDRLVVIWLATEAVRRHTRLIGFRSAAEILDAFELPKDGKSYGRLVAAFQRISTAQMSFSSDGSTMHPVWGFERVTFVDKARIWYARDVHQLTLPGGFENRILLSSSFWDEITHHKIPLELAVAGGLSDSPAILDFYCWIVWRANGLKKQTGVPLHSLKEQLGISDKTSLRQFRYQVRKWLKTIEAIWPECRASIMTDGTKLLLHHGKAIQDRA